MSMKWDSFKNMRNPSFYNDGQVQTDIECPVCGRNIFWDSRIVLTTYPEQYSYYCKCGWAGNSFRKWNGMEYAMTENLTQLDKLEEYLKENGIEYERIDTDDIHQINVPNSKNKKWDAICHYGSFGYKEGLLEIYGEIVPENIGDTVEGYLTAEDVINRINEHEMR